MAGSGRRKEIRAHRAAETGNGRGVKGHSLGERPPQFARHDGQVFLLTVDVAEGQTNELDVFLLHVLDDFFRCALHGVPRFLAI